MNGKQEITYIYKKLEDRPMWSQQKVIEIIDFIEDKICSDFNSLTHELEMSTIMYSILYTLYKKKDFGEDVRVVEKKLNEVYLVIPDDEVTHRFRIHKVEDMENYPNTYKIRTKDNGMFRQYVFDFSDMFGEQPLNW